MIISWRGWIVYHDYAEKLINDRVPFLIGGDFNVIPEDKDCHDPKAWDGDAAFRSETHEKYRSLQKYWIIRCVSYI